MPTSNNPDAKMTIGATVSRDVVREAKLYAVSQERSFSFIVEKALSDYLATHRPATQPVVTTL